MSRWTYHIRTGRSGRSASVRQSDGPDGYQTEIDAWIAARDAMAEGAVLDLAVVDQKIERLRAGGKRRPAMPGAGRPAGATEGVLSVEETGARLDAMRAPGETDAALARRLGVTRAAVSYARRNGVTPRTLANWARGLAPFVSPPNGPQPAEAGAPPEASGDAD